ncbi:MAG: phosphoserine transaminase [Rhodospirillales bacterium]|nr:phosphoserine transaminase [Rhodospirillales bacterium]MDE0713147.1 phosphoserine transaminase [Rhodospirillales bacterium]
MIPSERPLNPCFSSGPCAKRPGWTPDVLRDARLGRSHRAPIALDRIREVLDRTRELLSLPVDYRIALVPASDTGAMEMALWSLLGARGVDVLAWESFGKGWATDVTSQLQLTDARIFEAPYGELPGLDQVDFDRDVVFAWNGTTSGVCVPDAAWIGSGEGLVICDATSAAWAMPVPWSRLDVATFSWQKAMGGEAQHGMLILSPRAVERLESYRPPWPLPKIFRMVKRGRVDEALFRGGTINTPSLLCVEDALDSLRWIAAIGGEVETRARSRANLEAASRWVAGSRWADFLAARPEIRSSTSMCFRITDEWFAGLDTGDQRARVEELVGLLEEEGVAYDIASYREAPPGLRVWGGATVETADLGRLFPWLDYAFSEIKRKAGA